ncbi:MAG: DUF1403 family protein [Methylocystis sp.]
MLEFDSDAFLETQSPSQEMKNRPARIQNDTAAGPQKSRETQPFPRWARVRTRRGEDPDAAAGVAFAAGVSLALLDNILRSGADVSSDGKNVGANGAEQVFVGILRQRLALRAAAGCAAMARLREDEAALRDAEHLAGFDAALSPGARLHRLWRLFATCPRRPDAQYFRVAADCLELPHDINCAALMYENLTCANPLTAAARVSAEAAQILVDAPQIDAEFFALWLADFVLARRFAWAAPLPLLATTITHPSMRTASGRRPRPSDVDWSASVARAMALAAQEAYALAGELWRRSETLLSHAPKLRAKRAVRVVDLLLSDDCVSASRAAKAAGLSDRASRRLFDRLVELGAVRELSGRANFRLYGL